MNPVPCSPSSLPSFEQASEFIQQYCRKLVSKQQERVGILEGLHRVLAEPILSDRDFPPFSRAARDGYAVRASDIGTVPAVLEVVGQVKAGGSWDKNVSQGQAIQIMTGAAVPPCVDTVIMVEHTRRNNSQVEVLRSANHGENVVSQGSEAKAGEEVVPPGTRLSSAHLAVAAAVGKATLLVYRKPMVAILATGDELVEVATTPSSYQIRNSNTYSLAAQVTACGGEPVALPIATDEKASLGKLIRRGLSANLLLVTGGVSMGEFDLVEEVLTDLGARFVFNGVQIQPGRPVVFGEVESIPFFGLPGNPVSTMVTFDLFVHPVLQALSGALPVRLPAATARLAKDIKTKTGLTRFLPALLSGGLYNPEVELIPWQGSGDIAASARANCYVVVPPDRERMAAGEMISILLRTL